MRDRKSKKNQKEVLKIENTVTKMKNIFDGLMSRLDTADIRVSELEDTSTETSKTERQRQKTEWKINGKISKGITYT